MPSSLSVAAKFALGRKMGAIRAIPHPYSFGPVIKIQNGYVYSIPNLEVCSAESKKSRIYYAWIDA